VITSRISLAFFTQSSLHPKALCRRGPATQPISNVESASIFRGSYRNLTSTHTFMSRDTTTHAHTCIRAARPFPAQTAKAWSVGGHLKAKLRRAQFVRPTGVPFVSVFLGVVLFALLSDSCYLPGQVVTGVGIFRTPQNKSHVPQALLLRTRCVVRPVMRTPLRIKMALEVNRYELRH
jgi:hypothetical protein